jgi:MFS family permease
MWMPTLLKMLTHQGFGMVGVIAMLPYLTAAAFLWCNGWMADHSRRYAFHVFLPMTLAAISLILSVVIGESMLGLSILFLCLAMGGALAYDGPFWAAASRTLPVALVAGAMGLINALGNLGGYLGPFLGGYLQDVTHSFFATALLFAGSLFLAGILMLTIPLRGVAPREAVVLGAPAE